MKTTARRISWIMYGLLLGGVMYNCKTKDVASITPFTYTFAGLDNIKLPELTQTAPAAVTVTAGTVTSSTLAAAVTSALSNISATGEIPAVVKQAGADIAQTVPAEKAASLVSGFTPDMINSGALSAEMKSQMSAIASSPALKAYMPSFTLPMVNGKPIGARIAAPTVATTAAAKAALLGGDVDACKQGATEAYNTVLGKLDATKASQTSTVNATYTQLETAANGDVAGCQAGVPAKYAPLRSTLKEQLTTSLATLNSIKSILGADLYNQLALMAYVGYFQALDNVDTIQSADGKACTATKDAKIAAAKVARDTDLNHINSNYNTALTEATTARDKAIASCHNQGTGG
ncbi:hypothetical protein [Spirosoma sp. KNUC1025]|uniref:hypothetical protein n=1 Tax=Spirosoma sp. KNUC1025 TaxID=2894082 RepID=UPI003868F903|nr:hypothetical protein LN737_09725 [Spirosoma sp. KNUC1025]